MTKALLPVLLMVMLAGCASKPVIVEKPVPVTCQTPKPKEPNYPVVDPQDGLFVRVQKLLAIDTLKSAYVEQLEAWGLNCNV